MNWIIESDIFEENLERLHSELDKRKSNYKIVKYFPFSPIDNVIECFPKDEPTTFYGSLNLAKKLQDLAPWIIIHNNLEQYECTYYYPKLEEWLVNSECLMLHMDSVDEKIFDWAGRNLVFARPSSGFKTFDGRPLGLPGFGNQLSNMKRDCDPADVVIISKYKKILLEYRLIVADQVVTGSQYKNNGELETGPVPQAVIDYADNVLRSTDYRPDKIWTMDICSTEQGLHILEVGGFSCAGWYDSDISKILDEINP